MQSLKLRAMVAKLKRKADNGEAGGEGSGGGKKGTTKA
jgi:hypothetical protein